MALAKPFCAENSPLNRSPVLMLRNVKIRGLGVETIANTEFGKTDAPKTIPPSDNHLRFCLSTLCIISPFYFLMDY